MARRRLAGCAPPRTPPRPQGGSESQPRACCYRFIEQRADLKGVGIQGRAIRVQTGLYVASALDRITSGDSCSCSFLARKIISQKPTNRMSWIAYPWAMSRSVRLARV